MDRLISWSELWKLQFNKETCNAMKFGHQSEAQYHMMEKNLEQIVEEKVLVCGSPHNWSRALVLPFSSVRSLTWSTCRCLRRRCRNSGSKPVYDQFRKQRCHRKSWTTGPVLTRVTERMVVRRYIYPLPDSAVASSCTAFRWSVCRLDDCCHHFTLINILSTEPYVIVISLDSSKTFETVRHSTWLYKFSQLDLPGHIYN